MIEQIYSYFRLHPTISTDTRRITPGSIFFALHGATFDGNDYALSALEAGAAYCVVDREGLGELSERIVEVEDTLVALQALARHHRRELGIDILAISGSNGKTTTKELVSRALAEKYNLYATQGNLNNHIGVPLTLLAMDHTTEIGVVEMGASSCHEIELLCSIAEPNYGVLTNVGRAHLEGFGGEEGVRRGKGELFDFLAKSGGVAFVARESEVIMQMARERLKDGLKVVEYSYDLGGEIEHHLEGEYNRYNVATAVATAQALGVEREAISRAIESYHPTNNRSQRVETDRNTLIVDCYNANPSSMQASIENFCREVFSARASKVVILGDMFELGEWSEMEHRRVIDLVSRGGVDHIYLVGKEFSRVSSQPPLEESEERDESEDAAIKRAKITSFETRQELEEYLKESPLSGVVALVKGSRGVGLEKILTLL